MSGHVEMSGEVVEVCRDKFKVKINGTDTIILAQLSGKMRMNKIRITLGDFVKVRMSAYDLTHGILVSRQ